MASALRKSRDGDARSFRLPLGRQEASPMFRRLRLVEILKRLYQSILDRVGPIHVHRFGEVLAFNHFESKVEERIGPLIVSDDGGWYVVGVHEVDNGVADFSGGRAKRVRIGGLAIGSGEKDEQLPSRRNGRIEEHRVRAQERMDRRVRVAWGNG